MLSLFRIYQTVNSGYDTYSEAVVVAEDSEQARHISPDGGVNDLYTDLHTWAHPKFVYVEYLGPFTNEAYKAGDVVCASFHAG